MSIIILVVATLIIVSNIVIAWRVFKKDTLVDDKKNDTGLQLLMQEMHNLRNTVDNKIGESAKEMNESVRHQFSESQKLIKDVTEGLTKLDETNKQVVSFADQLQ